MESMQSCVKWHSVGSAFEACDFVTSIVFHLTKGGSPAEVLRMSATDSWSVETSDGTSTFTLAPNGGQRVAITAPRYVEASLRRWLERVSPLRAG